MPLERKGWRRKLPHNRKKIVIVGGGASGTLLAVRGASEWTDTDIYLIEKSGEFGPGLAYSPGKPDFVLNVPAGKMGAFAEQPGHFFEWLQTNGNIWRPLHSQFSEAEFSATDFVPRIVYGAYLKDLLATASKTANLNGNVLHLVHDTAENISASNDEKHPLIVATGKGEVIPATAVVFATGNSSSRFYHPPSSNIFAAPYSCEFLDREWSDTDHILLLGAGLSMVDAVCYLSANAYPGKITCISRNALRPLPHISGTYPVDPPFDASNRPDKPSMLLNRLKKGISEAQKKNIPWQAVLDSLRPFSNDLWTSLPVDAQKKLWRILSRWNAARHRIPEFSDQCLNRMIANGQLAFCKGHITSIKEHANGVTLSLRDGKTIQGTLAVHCLGFDYSVRKLQSICADTPLVSHWTGNPASVPHKPYTLSSNHPLYGIGPVFFGQYIESTAIPDIRQQAMHLSKLL